LEGLTQGRYIKTRLPLDGLPFSDRVRYIVVGRDNLDIFMSMWHHWNNMRPESIDRINATPRRVHASLPVPPADIRMPSTPGARQLLIFSHHSLGALGGRVKAHAGRVRRRLPSVLSSHKAGARTCNVAPVSSRSLEGAPFP
jgi:hypothetical protein